MNNPFALTILFAAIVVVWAVFLLTVLTILKGRARERTEHVARLRRTLEQHTAHGDPAQR